MDRILNYLPEIVHIRVGYEQEQRYYGDYCGVDWVDYEIPKAWLKHGKCGSYNEWTLKKTYEKKFIEQYGDKILHKTEAISVLEWNQLQDMVIVFNKAKNIGFNNILELVPSVESMDAKYFNQVLI